MWQLGFAFCAMNAAVGGIQSDSAAVRVLVHVDDVSIEDIARN
jgi:hypothetical protein